MSCGGGGLAGVGQNGRASMDSARVWVGKQECEAANSIRATARRGRGQSKMRDSEKRRGWRELAPARKPARDKESKEGKRGQ